MLLYVQSLHSALTATKGAVSRSKKSLHLSLEKIYCLAVVTMQVYLCIAL